MAARTRSASPERSKLIGLAARKHYTCGCFRIRACSALLGRSTLALAPARLRWGARDRRSSPLGSAGPETLHWARPRMPVALNTETNILEQKVTVFFFGLPNVPGSSKDRPRVLQYQSRSTKHANDTLGGHKQRSGCKNAKNPTSRSQSTPFWRSLRT